MPKYRCGCSAAHLTSATQLVGQHCCEVAAVHQKISRLTWVKTPETFSNLPCPFVFSSFLPCNYFVNWENPLYNYSSIKPPSPVAKFHPSHLGRLCQIPPFSLQPFLPDVISLQCIMLGNPGRWWRAVCHPSMYMNFDLFDFKSVQGQILEQLLDMKSAHHYLSGGWA